MGSFASVDGKVGKTTVAPDSDLEVKLEWAEGGTSSYMKANRLSKSNEDDFKRARRQHEEAEARRRQHEEARRQEHVSAPPRSHKPATHLCCSLHISNTATFRTHVQTLI